MATVGVMKTKGLTCDEVRQENEKIASKAAKRAAAKGEPGLYCRFDLWKYYTPAMRRREEELNCIDMINSCLIYGSAYYDFFVRGKGFVGQYALPYVETLGEDRVKELFDAQVERFKRAEVHVGVWEDHEGCSYNSVDWH